MEKKTRIERNNTNFSLQLFEYFRAAQKQDGKKSPYDFLKYYQNIVRLYVTGVDTDARGLLIEHEMGMGKSILAIAIAIDLIRERQPIILLTKSLQENMRSSIVKYVKLRATVDPTFFLCMMSDTDLSAWINANFQFVSMNASNMLKQMNNASEGSVAEEFDAVMEKKFGDITKLGSLNGKLLIVDEAHNLFRAITNGSKNALGLYEMVMRSKDLKVMFFTGTPIANDPFELVPCFNMLGSKTGKPILPEHYFDFRKMYIDPRDRKKMINRGKFQNRINGLWSYVSHTSSIGRALGADVTVETEFPEELPTKVVHVPMSNDQYVMYGLARDREKEEGSRFGPGSGKEPANMTKPKSSASSTYRVHSRQISNFCAPNGFRDEKDPDRIPVEALGAAKFVAIVNNIEKHPKQLGLVYSQFTGVGGLGTFSRYLKSLGWEEVKIPKRNANEKREGGMTMGGYSNPDRNEGMDSNLEEYYALESINSSHLPPAEALIEQLNKIGGAIEEGKINKQFWLDESDADEANDIEALNIEKPDMEYPFVDGAFEESSEDSDDDIGIVWGGDDDDDVVNDGEVLDNDDAEEAEVEALKPVSAEESNALIAKIGKGKLRYMIISGEVDVEDRSRLQAIFTSPDNMRGEICNLILISSTGAEGLDLKCIRHIHAMEPYWNLGRLLQINARGVRNDSHKMLPADEKNVQPYVYLAVPPQGMELDPSDPAYEKTTDVDLYEESLESQIIIYAFLEAGHEVSIECLVNEDPNNKSSCLCRKCSPTNELLYSSDIVRDLRATDPCHQVEEKAVAASALEYDGKQYYYKANTKNIYGWDIFEHDAAINGYRPMRLNNPLYIEIVEKITTPASNPDPPADDADTKL